MYEKLKTLKATLIIQVSSVYGYGLQTKIFQEFFMNYFKERSEAIE